ncbi:MAG: cyclic nucleotide-binding/CBS domain-containing protein [Candidatus Bathyarchaeia archaeon]
MPITTTVRDVMTKDLISVKTTDPAIAAIEAMTKNNIGSVVVTEDGKPVGILTERDIMKKVCPEKLCTSAVTAGQVMSKPLITIEADARLGEAAMLMTEKDIRRLLVTDKGKVVGIITQKDIMRGTLETFMVLASI